MTTILADSFAIAPSKLSNDEQKQIKLMALDLQTNSHLQMHSRPLDLPPRMNIQPSIVF